MPRKSVNLCIDTVKEPTGNLDGIYSVYVFGNFGQAWDVMIDSKSRIVASGGSYEGDFAVMRFLPRLSDQSSHMGLSLKEALGKLGAEQRCQEF